MMKTMKFFLTFACLLSLASAGFAAEKMKLVEDKSKIEFVGSKPSGDKHEGGFKKFQCEAMVDSEKPTASKITLVIDATSIWSDNGKLTNHLKNPDFFDIRKYPKIEFKSKKIAMTEGDKPKAEITGDWTMLGKTVEIVIPAKVKHTDSGIELDADFKIDRTKWGMDYGEGKIDKDVVVRAKLVLKS